MILGATPVLAQMAQLAHVAGWPIEEAVALAIAASATASVGLRLAWYRLRTRAGRRSGR